jgi:hypothetical protein
VPPHIDPALGGVLSGVQEHIGERVPDLARGVEHAHVVAIAEDSASSLEDAVHDAGEPGAERLHAAAERSPVVRLQEEVRMIR